MLLIDKAKAMDVLRMRLEALSTDGLNAPSMNAEYICRYKGSLIGKHFKSLAQLMPFAIYDLVPRHLLQAWNAIGELVVQLWHTEIDDIEKYLVRMTSQSSTDCLANRELSRLGSQERLRISSISQHITPQVFSSRSQSFISSSTCQHSSDVLDQRFSTLPSATRASTTSSASAPSTATVRPQAVIHAKPSPCTMSSSTL